MHPQTNHGNCRDRTNQQHTSNTGDQICMYINLHDMLVSTRAKHYIKKLHKKQTVSHHISFPLIFFFIHFREEPCHATVLMLSSHQSKLQIWKKRSNIMNDIISKKKKTVLYHLGYREME